MKRQGFARTAHAIIWSIARPRKYSWETRDSGAHKIWGNLTATGEVEQRKMQTAKRRPPPPLFTCEKLSIARHSQSAEWRACFAIKGFVNIACGRNARNWRLRPHAAHLYAISDSVIFRKFDQCGIQFWLDDDALCLNVLQIYSLFIRCKTILVFMCT